MKKINRRPIRFWKGTMTMKIDCICYTCYKRELRIVHRLSS